MDEHHSHVNRILEPEQAALLAPLPKAEKMELLRRMGILDRVMSAPDRGAVIVEWSKDVLTKVAAAQGLVVDFPPPDQMGFTEPVFTKAQVERLDEPPDPTGTLPPER